MKPAHRLARQCTHHVLFIENGSLKRSGKFLFWSVQFLAPGLSNHEEAVQKPLKQQTQGRDEIGNELYSLMIDRSIPFSIFSYL
jgi:hypothetical protein